MTDGTKSSSPAPFTAEDFAVRLGRAAQSAAEAGLTGLLLTPGPDLLYLTGYAPVAITERITSVLQHALRQPHGRARVPGAHRVSRSHGATVPE